MSSDARTTTGTDQPWTVGRVIDWTTGHLKKHGSDTPRLDAEILLAHARGCPRIQLYTHYDEVLDDEVRASMQPHSSVSEMFDDVLHAQFIR